MQYTGAEPEKVDQNILGIFPVFGKVRFTCKLLRIYSYIYECFMNEAQCVEVLCIYKVKVYE